MTKEYHSILSTPLSNYYPSSFVHKGDTLSSAEQFIMTSPARLFGDQEAVVAFDQEAVIAIQKEPSPSKQKFIGQTIKKQTDNILE